MTYTYSLTPKRFSKDLFKFCTICAMFETNFANIFCEDCGTKLEYVKVPPSMKSWLNEPCEKVVPGMPDLEYVPSSECESEYITKFDNNCCVTPKVLNFSTVASDGISSLAKKFFNNKENIEPMEIDFSDRDYPDYPEEAEMSYESCGWARSCGCESCEDEPMECSEFDAYCCDAL